MEPERLRVALSQQGLATVTAKGIKFHSIYYQCPTAIEENWFSAARVKGSWRINIAYHPNEMENIYWLKSGGQHEVCIQTEDSRARYAGDTLEEIDWIQRRQKKQQAAYSEVSLQSSVDSSAAIDAIIRKANRERKTVPLEPVRNRTRADEIRKNRKAEAAKLRGKEGNKKNIPKEDNAEDFVGLRSTSAYDAAFAGFLNDDEEDE